MTEGTVVYKYLIRHKLVDKYINAIKNYDKDVFDEFMEAKKEKKLIDFLNTHKIANAFSWAMSTEGYAFWFRHSTALNKELRGLY